MKRLQAALLVAAIGAAVTIAAFITLSSSFSNDVPLPQTASEDYAGSSRHFEVNVTDDIQIKDK